MPPKKYKLGETHGFIGDTDNKSKPKPGPDISWITDCWRLRDRVIYRMTKDPETIEAIKQRYKF